MINERWFISYGCIELDFILSVEEERTLTYHNIITNMTPANWMKEHNINYNILYAERISPALASELTHGGAGIPTEYFNEDDV